RAGSLASTIANELETARRLHAIAAEKAQTRHAAEVERIEREAKERTEMYNEYWRSAVEQAGAAREAWPPAIEDKWRRVADRQARLSEERLNAIEQEHNAKVTHLNADTGARREYLTAAHQAKTGKFNADYQAHWQKLEADWKQRITPLYAQIEAANIGANQQFL